MTSPPYEPLPDEQVRHAWHQHFAHYDRGDGNVDDVFEQLLAVYRNPGRYYHTIEHGMEVATTTRTLAGDLSSDERDDVALAAWTHDSHYHRHADDNEDRSADLARDAARQLGMSSERVERVAELVRVSSHTITPATHLQAMMCDADLATLAKPWDFYMIDVANIRAELAVDEHSMWRTTRLAMLNFFETKNPLYHSRVAAQRWEAAAVANRQREQALLTRA